MRSFSFRNDGKLGNQLIALFHCFNEANGDDVKLYFPHFGYFEKYFKITSFVDREYFDKNGANFTDLLWDDLKDGGDILRFEQFRLKPEYEDMVDWAFSRLKSKDLVAVHIRHGYFRDWNNGSQYFDTSTYSSETRRVVSEWGLEDPQIVVFSDEDQQSCGFLQSKELTGGDPVLDMFLMARFNYFVRTFSTFSGVALRMSQLSGRYKNHHQMLK